ncbi:hypothetical protein E5288_WYG015299 [Bos mutus]|uniref:Uncharacterized protein n=1 Tax=Bos mutus TaxID=72004 RepID=A0A6B0RKL6_9CETA|nr:hypothetical protein [Bos mutus]
MNQRTANLVTYNADKDTDLKEDGTEMLYFPVSLPCQAWRAPAPLSGALGSPAPSPRVSIKPLAKRSADLTPSTCLSEATPCLSPESLRARLGDVSIFSVCFRHRAAVLLQCPPFSMTLQPPLQTGADFGRDEREDHSGALGTCQLEERKCPQVVLEYILGPRVFRKPPRIITYWVGLQKSERSGSVTVWCSKQSINIQRGFRREIQRIPREIQLGLCGFCEYGDKALGRKRSRVIQVSPDPEPISRDSGPKQCSHSNSRINIKDTSERIKPNAFISMAYEFLSTGHSSVASQM